VILFAWIIARRGVGSSIMNNSTIVTSPITALASVCAAFIDNLDVEDNWLPRVADDC
jgi:hypothetical protein